MLEEKNNPVKKFTAGGIHATIWRNRFGDGTNAQDISSSISLTKSYIDKDGKWQNSSSYYSGDLPKIIIVLKKAYEFMVLKKDTDTN